MSAQMACKEIVEMLSDYLEGALSPEVSGHVEAHVSGCDGCAMVLDQLRATIATAGRVQEDALSEDQRETLLAAFRHHTGGRA